MRQPDERPHRLGDLVAPPPAWMADATCARPEWSDLDPFRVADAEAFAEACAVCPVRASCEAYVDELDIRDGLWAGQYLNGRKKRAAA